MVVQARRGTASYAQVGAYVYDKVMSDTPVRTTAMLLKVTCPNNVSLPFFFKSIVLVEGGAAQWERRELWILCRA